MTTTDNAQRGLGLVTLMVLILILGALLFGAYLWIMLSWSYASGERAGWVQRDPTTGTELLHSVRYLDPDIERQQVAYQARFPFQCQELARECQSVDQAEEQRKKIDQRQAFYLLFMALKNIVYTGCCYR